MPRPVAPGFGTSFNFGAKAFTFFGAKDLAFAGAGLAFNLALGLGLACGFGIGRDLDGGRASFLGLVACLGARLAAFFDFGCGFFFIVISMS